MSDEAAKQAPAAWDVPAIERADDEILPTAGRLEALQQEAYDEAFEKGQAEGLAAGEGINALLQSVKVCEVECGGTAPEDIDTPEDFTS